MSLYCHRRLAVKCIVKGVNRQSVYDFVWQRLPLSRMRAIIVHNAILFLISCKIVYPWWRPLSWRWRICLFTHSVRSIFAAWCYASVALHCNIAYAAMRCPSICLSVRPSVRPSVTFVNSVETNKHIFKLFPPSGSHTIPVFFVPNIMVIFRWGPPNGGVECRWGWAQIAAVNLNLRSTYCTIKAADRHEAARDSRATCLSL